MFDDEKTTIGSNGLSAQFDAFSKPGIAVDVERYQAYLDGSDMTETEKEEFLQALWEIIVGFVEFGFAVHPLQEVCGKDAKGGSKTASEAFDEVCSDEPEQKEKPNGFNP